MECVSLVDCIVLSSFTLMICCRFTTSVAELMIANSFNEFRQHVRSRQENNRAAIIASTDVDVIRQRRWYYRNCRRVRFLCQQKTMGHFF